MSVSFSWKDSGTTRATSAAAARAIQRSARIMASVSAWMVRGLARTKPASAYSTEVGTAPPNTCRVPAAVRASTSTRIRPLCCMSVTAGSGVQMASICPLATAETAEAPMPTPMMDTSCESRCAPASTRSTMRCVVDPGADTPIRAPLRSATWRMRPACGAATARASCMELAITTKASRWRPADCIRKVCSYTPATTSALPPTSACRALLPPLKSLISTLRPASVK